MKIYCYNWKEIRSGVRAAQSISSCRPPSCLRPV